MKKIATILIALFTVTLMSCDEDILKLATMSAEIDGNEWTTALRATVLTSETFVITGTSADGTIITITILGEEEGTYQLSIIPSVSEFTASYIEETSVEGTFLSTSGEVVLSKVDKENMKISGEFYFTGNNLTGTVNITDGEFTDLKYTEQ